MKYIGSQPAYQRERSVMTYGQIAVLLNAPNCARLVGQAMYNTPEHMAIPAHRVVNSKGGLAPSSAFGGEGVQRRRLEEEGVLFTKSGYVDLKRSIFLDAGNREQ